jgi:hypothetical protein
VGDIPLYTHASSSILAQGNKKKKKATALTEEPPPVHSKSDAILNTSIYLSFMLHVVPQK